MVKDPNPVVRAFGYTIQGRGWLSWRPTSVWAVRADIRHQRKWWLCE